MRAFPNIATSLTSYVGAALFLLTGLLAAAPAEASHFRYGLLYWELTGSPGQVEFTFEGAFRRCGYFGSGSDGCPVTGDIITETIGATGIDFGDGSSTGTLQFVVIAFDVAEDFIIGRALNPGTMNPGVLHTYAGTGTTYTASVNGCCRISNLNNRNDGSYILETIVSFNGNAPPVSTLVPIVVVNEGPTSTFLVPAVDPNGDTLRWREATSAEAGGGDNPPNFDIDASTGLVTWNTVGLNQSNPWTAQVVIEDLDGNGNVKSKTPVDFLLQIVPSTGNNPPTCSITPSGPFSVEPGQTVSFTVTGQDADPGDTITLNTGGLPPGATMTPSLPVSGPSGTSSVFDWTPDMTQLGVYSVVFSVQDDAGSQGLCSAEITVRQMTGGSCEDFVDIMVTASSTMVPAAGGSIIFDVTVTNNGNAACFTDCYVLAKKLSNGRILLQEQFGPSGFLPPGGSINGPYELVFPPEAPNTSYKVRFYAGVVATGEIYDRQTFIVTKGGMRLAQPGLDEGAEWDDEDDFAKAGATAVVGAPAEVAASPNPFAGRTTLAFSVEEMADVRLAVYDVLGREVAILVEGSLDAGSHRAVFDAQGLAAGVYVYRLVVGESVQTGRMTLTR